MGADGLRSEIYQIEDRDSWVCLFDIMGAVKLRYGLEVQDGFLMIRNIPWSSKDKVERIGNAALNGMGLKVYPAACKLQLPGLHSTAAEKSRASALQGMGHLYPLLSSGYATMDNAADLHMGTDLCVFEGREVTGWPVMTILRGKIIAENDKFVGQPGDGQFVKGKLEASLIDTL